MHINPLNTSRTRKFRLSSMEYEITLHALACTKLTFAETVSYALTQESAFLLCNQTFKAHKVEIEEHTWGKDLLEKIYNMQKALECQQIPPTSEAVIWAEIDGGYGPNKLWIVEATKESTPNLLIGETLAMTRQDKRVSVRVLNECKLPIKLSKVGAVSRD